MGYGGGDGLRGEEVVFSIEEGEREREKEGKRERGKKEGPLPKGKGEGPKQNPKGERRDHHT